MAPPVPLTEHLRGGRPAFGRLAGAHVLAVAGDTLVTIALADSVFFTIPPQAARGRVALYLLLTVAPFALLSPLIGPTLDRGTGRRRAVLVATAVSRLALCLGVATRLDTLWLFPMAFALLVMSKAHIVAKSALVPSLVADERQLVAANARLAVLGVVGGLAASLPGLAVLRIGPLGAPWVARLAGLAFAGSAVYGLRVPAPDRKPASRTSGGDDPATAPDVDRVPASIRVASGAMGALRGIAGFLTFVVAFAFRSASASSWEFGLVLAVGMGSTLAGSAIAPRLRRSFGEERIIQGCLVVVGVAAVLAGRLDGWPGAALAAAVVGLALSAAKLAFDSIVQRDAPDAVRGRTFARFETHFQIAWVVGAAVPVVLPLSQDDGLGLVGLGAVLTFFAYLGGLAAAAARARPVPRDEPAEG